MWIQCNEDGNPYGVMRVFTSNGVETGFMRGAGQKYGLYIIYDDEGIHDNMHQYSNIMPGSKKLSLETKAW